MLNREKCRLILGDDLNLGDDELDRLRHQLRALAQVAISSAQRHDSRGNAPSSSLEAWEMFQKSTGARWRSGQQF